MTQLALILHTREEWLARFDRAEVTLRDGTMRLGWACPDCGQVEVNEFLLGNNHGWHVHWVGHEPHGGEGLCTRLWLRRNHAIYDQRRAMVSHLISAGLSDEEIAARIRWWTPETIAGYRKDDEKAARRAAKAARGERVTVPHGDLCPCAFCEGPCDCRSCQEFRGELVPSDGELVLF